MAADDQRTADTVGKEFADGYYNALIATIPGNERLLKRFYDHKSKYLFLRNGSGPESQMRGANEISQFAIRMKYHEFAVNVVSVDTIKVRQPNFFAVLTVCKLTRLGNSVSHEFIQSTVVRYVPLSPSSSENNFTIVGTVFKFSDSTAADIGLEPDFETPKPVKSEPEPSSSVPEEESLSSVPESGPSRAAPKKLSDLLSTNTASAKWDDDVHAVAIVIKSENKSRKNKTKRAKRKVEIPVAADDTAATTIKDLVGSSKNSVDAKVDPDDSESKQKHTKGKTKAKTVVSVDTSCSVTTKNIVHLEHRQPLKPEVELPVHALVDDVDIVGPERLQVNDANKCPAKVKMPTAETRTVKANSNDGNTNVLNEFALFVSGLSENTSPEDMYKSFCKYDEAITVLQMGHKKNKVKNTTRFYSIVQFSDRDKMIAVANLQTFQMANGDTVNVQKSNKKKRNGGKS